MMFSLYQEVKSNSPCKSCILKPICISKFQTDFKKKNLYYINITCDNFYDFLHKCDKKMEKSNGRLLTTNEVYYLILKGECDEQQMDQIGN